MIRLRELSTSDRNISRSHINQIVRTVNSLLTVATAQGIELIPTPFGPLLGGRKRKADRVGGTETYTAVQVKKDGGTAGTQNAKCSFTYGIWPVSIPLNQTDSTNRLAEKLTPKMQRTTVGAYVQAIDGSEGLARFDGMNWQLLIAYDEVPKVGGCGCG